ncbi:MAG: helix-turn-helix domain-containing protein [Deltaproteobacteria bacterium]|nr:helix-turn-helix domain-containing protein [Deltaproteobacteria bacterium]
MTGIPAGIASGTVGERLQQRRLARGLGLEAVTRATRLTRTVLEALEEDRFDDLPAPVYARGFLKIYATYLELDTDAMLDAYQSQLAVRQALAEEQAAAAASPEYLRDREPRGRSLSPASALMLVATAAIALVFMWSVSKRQKPTVARPEILAPAGGTAATAIGPAAPAPVAPRSSGLPPLPGREAETRR